MVGHLCGYTRRGVKQCIPNETVLKYIEEHEAAKERKGHRAKELNSNKSKITKGMQPPANVIVQDRPFLVPQ